MEREVIESDMILPTHFRFKNIQMHEKYPKGQVRSRQWKHLKQILPAENYQNHPPHHPNYVNIESPPSMHPRKHICDITGFEKLEERLLGLDAGRWKHAIQLRIVQNAQMNVNDL